MIDIDNFKIYNDTHGHQAGDRLLREAVAAWTELLREGELLARYGGEEFTVLLACVTLAEAQARIEALSAVTPDGQTFSAGVSTWDPGTEPASAVAAADKALYLAKRTGRDRVLTYDDSALPAEGSRHRGQLALTTSRWRLAASQTAGSPGSADSVDGSR
jgi:diguanylate cyclase (GGDEF)-like protein